MSQSPPNDDVICTKEENKMLKDKLERANQQIKLLAAVLQIVHEDLSMKNEQLEILYSNLRQNPVWQDCMAVVHSSDDSQRCGNENNHPDYERNKGKSKDDTSRSPMIIITKRRENTRSRSLSPRHSRTPITQNNVASNQQNHARHKLLMSSDIFRTINEDTKCYLNCMAEDTQIALCSFVPYNDLIHLAQTNKLWRSIIQDDLVWRICFRVKWPLDEFTYSSDDTSSDGNDNNHIHKNADNGGTEIAFDRFHKSLHKRNHSKKRKKRKKRKKKQIASEQKEIQHHLTVDDVCASPELSSSPPCTSSNGMRDASKSWKRQFKDRIHIEKNWRQGKAKVMTLIGHNGSVTDLKFDEYRLITSSDDGSIILWRLDTMKKWKPKHYERHRKQLEKGNESQSLQKYTFFPTKKEQERKHDAVHEEDINDEHEHKHEDDHKPQRFPRPSIQSTDDNDSDSLSSSYSTSHHSVNDPNTGYSLQLNNLYNLNDNWNMNDTKLSAWRHSFVTSFGSAFRNRLPMLSTTKKKKATKTWGSQLDTESMLLQNHHYSKDLNFKRLSFQGHGGPIWALDFDNELLVSGSYDKCIKIWNILNANCRATLRGHEEWVSGIKLRHKYIVSCSWDASIRLWKLDDTRFSGRCITTLQSQPGNAIYCIQWSMDRNFIVSGCRHQAVQIWDLQKEKMIKTFMGHLKQVYCIQVSNSLILSGSADRTIKMWDPRTAGCLASFDDHMGPVMKLQFDDHKLISAGYDKQVRIFDLRARKQLHSLSGHSKVIFSLQYDHKKIITGSADKRVLVWNFNG